MKFPLPWRITLYAVLGAVLIVIGLAAIQWFGGLLPSAFPGAAMLRRSKPVAVQVPMASVITGRKKTLFHKAVPPVPEAVKRQEAVTLEPTKQQEKAIEDLGFKPQPEGYHLQGIWHVPCIDEGAECPDAKRNQHRTVRGYAMVSLDPEGRPKFTFAEDTPGFFETPRLSEGWRIGVGPYAATDDGYGVTGKVSKDLLRTGVVHWVAQAGGDLTSGKFRGRVELNLELRPGSQ